jgi:hypothetical protein
MTAEDIIDRLTPVAQNKLRFTDNQLNQILTSSVLPYDSDMELVINVCGEFLSKSPVRVLANELTSEELLRRYKASKLLLWSHYYALMPNFFPRNPDEGDVVTKVIGKKTVGFECKNGVFEEVTENLPVAE